MDRLTMIRDGRSAARQLRSLARIGAVTPRELDRLLNKIDAGFAAALDDGGDPGAAQADIPLVLADLAARGLSMTHAAMLSRSPPPPAPARYRVVTTPKVTLGVIDGDRP